MTACLTPSQDPNNKTRKPKHRRQKAERLRRVPLPTVIICHIDIAPGPDAATFDLVIVVVLQETEDREPGSAEEQVSDEVDDGGAGECHPEQREPHGDGRDDGAVDEAREGADVVRFVLVQEVGAQAEDDGCGDELHEAQGDGDDA